MGELKDFIIERILAEGPITFRDFMELALYHPQWGYYSSSAARIGKDGDFFTSVSVGEIFGRLLARQIAEMLKQIGPPYVVVEIGAGQGYLAQDVISELGKLVDKFTYGIIEISPEMVKSQRERLKDLAHVVWLDNIEDFAPLKGVVFSNELVDSFPVHLVEMRDDGLKEVFVSIEDGSFVEVLQEPSTPELQRYFADLGVELPIGFRTEVNLEAVRWITTVARTLSEGFVITVDYGYPSHELYQPYRSKGTLIAYRGHRTSEDILESPGQQDITSHVNFSALKNWGEKEGLKVLGFTDQSHFLLALGLLDMISCEKGASPDMSQILQAKTLILPGGMGDTFKVLVQGKGVGSWLPRGLMGAPKRLSYKL